VLLIGACVLVFISIGAALVGLFYFAPRARLVERLAVLEAVRDEDLPLDQSLTTGFTGRVVAPMLSRLGGIVIGLTPGGALDALRRKLERGGNPWGITAVQFMGIRAMSVATFGLLAFTLYGLGYVDGLVNLLLGALVAALGILLPDYVLQSRINAREYGIRKSLPDHLDLLVASTEAGLGLDQAIAEVVARKPGPLADEFDRVLTEINLGKTHSQAWRDLSRRVELDDLRSFAAAIYQAQELGASIANVLRVQSESLRMRRTLKIREMAAKLATKMLFPLVFCIFPALLVVILGPAAISIYKALSDVGFGGLGGP
jgi:tight adherence protein C